MNRKPYWLRLKQLVRVFMIGGQVVCVGCTGQIRAAMVDHARASTAVAATLDRAASTLQCPQPAGSCDAVREVVSGQAQALKESAARLDRASRGD